MLNKKIIGVCGVARVGKNLFAEILIKQLKEKYNLVGKQFSLAYELKYDCKDFIQDKLGLNVFSESTEDKNSFREMLVWYGDVMRKRTNGKYWTDKLYSKMESEQSHFDIGVITDIRYDFYNDDEIDWVKNKLNGPIIHISKYTYGFPTDGRVVNIKGKTNYQKIYTSPANSHETINDPKLKKKADYLLEWEDVNYLQNLPYQMLIDNEYLNNTVITCLDHLKSKIIQ